MKSAPMLLGATDRDRTRKVLFDLLAGRPPAQVPALDQAGWDTLARMAREHLLGPLLHHRTAGLDAARAIPAPLLEEWEADFRASAIAALKFEGSLKRIAALLDRHAIPFALLKGNVLRWTIYPHPALRPTRDIDVLVAPHHASKTFDLLVGEGFARYSDDARSVTFTLKHDKQLPSLRDDIWGCQVEIHFRAIMEKSASNREAVLLKSEDLLERRRWFTMSGTEFPALPREEALLHLVVHAVDESTFHNGPLVLVDIGLFVKNETIDWVRFWHLAQQAGWVPASRLLFHLVASLDEEARIEWPEGKPPVVPTEIGEAASALMVQDKDAYGDLLLQVELADGTGKGRSAGKLLRRLLPRRHALAAFARAPDDAGAWVWSAYPFWLASRLWRTLRGRLSERQQAEAERAVRVIGWLKESQSPGVG
jgi:hypothetical protein